MASSGAGGNERVEPRATRAPRVSSDAEGGVLKRRKSPRSARRSPSQERSRRTVEAILEAAAQVFEARGHAGATTDRIAARAGVSIGSLYQYFPNKQALLAALVARHLEEGRAQLLPLLAPGEAGALPVDRALRSVVDAMIALHAARPRLHRVLTEETPLPPAVRRRYAEIEAELVDAVAALLARTAAGSVPSADRPDPRRAAWCLVHAVDALAHRLVLHPPADLGREALVDEIVRLAARYVAPGAAALAVAPCRGTLPRA